MQAGWTQDEMAPEILEALNASAARVPHPSGPVIEEIRSRVLTELSAGPPAAGDTGGTGVLALALAVLFGRGR